MEPQQRQPWNKGKLVGQKAPLKLRDIWAIRIRLQLRHRTRDLALFNLAIDSKLRACDLVKLRVFDVAHGGQVASRAVVMQQKTKRPVQFEITDLTRQSIHAWIEAAHLGQDAFLFPSRVHASPHISMREYARIVHCWGCRDRPGWCGLRYPLDATNEDFVDLPAYQESSGRAAATRAYQTRKYRPLPRHRGRRRAGNGRADRGLTKMLAGRGCGRGPAKSGRPRGRSLVADGNSAANLDGE